MRYHVEDAKKSKEKLLIRACHRCLKINESMNELERCSHCKKSFLPLRYFEKVHHAKGPKGENYFYSTELLDDEDLVKGLFVLW